MTAATTAASVQGGSQWVQAGPLTFAQDLTKTADRITGVAELAIPLLAGEAPYRAGRLCV